MRIQHNIMAMSAYRNYTNNVAAMKKNLEKLSSGYKINRAGDDAAGLAISEKMRAQITGLETAQKNAKDGISLVQTAEGALTEVHDMLNRMVELATMSANGTYDDTTDRAQLQKEVNQLRSEIDRIADSANFNGIKLLDGSMSKGMTQIGTTSDFSVGTAAVTDFVAVASSQSPLTWTAESNAISSATISQVPSTSVMHLHSGGGKAELGGFTIDLGGLSMTPKASAANAQTVTITLTNSDNKTLTLTATAASTGAGLTATGIANILKDKVLVVNANGTMALKAKTSNAAKGDLVYTISAGASGNANQLTFKPAAVANKVATYTDITASSAAPTTATKLASASDIPTTLASKQQVKFDFKVAGAVSSKATMSGFQQVGVTEYTNMKKGGGGQLGQAVVQLSASKIKDGMTIKVNGVEKTIRLSGTAGSGDIDLTQIAKKTTTASATTYSVPASKAKALAQAIANAFKDSELGGVEIGVDNAGNLIVAEKDKGGNVSGATEEVQKAMSSYTTFKDLVQFGTQEVVTPETKGSVNLNINTDKLRNGTTLTLTDAAGNVKKYAFTNDTTKTGTDANGATYVQMGSDVAAALKDVLGSDATLGSDGKTVTVTYKFGGGTLKASQVKAKAEVVGKNLTLQIGDTADSFNQLKVDIEDMHTVALGIDDAALSIADQDSAAKAVDKIKAAINKVSDLRGTLGATQNRLDHTINNLSVMTENIQDAESTIRDVDVAEEMMAYTKNNILIQSAQAMLAQANQVPQGVLQLLQ